MIERLRDNQSVIVAGHRGWKSAYPENTLLAFQEALKLGVDMLEFDLRFSKDRTVVVIHDETVDRTTNGSGRVGDFTLAELRELDAGGWFGKPFEGLKIPTLEELCELLSAYPDVLLNVEVKPSPDAKAVVDSAVAMLERFGYLPRCVFTCFDAEVLAYMHDAHGLKTQGFPGELMSGYTDGPEGTISKMWAVGLSMKLLTPQLARAYEEQGVLAWCYCPDSEQQVFYALGCGTLLMTVNDPLPAMQVREQLSRMP
ncbi:glycerophosphoryl diester phosphodiesterase [Paenibacillus sp. UNCCL117]|uniref:glycerophosphodiester phosphodiesterase family protein n=1 Tax=unclassified Paenibacillus TaxID=185978 RepID=UPI0008879753|nr:MULTISPECIES: glycerophosphodiester phosphodiesterase family protein [unclassified Paenibacillus]SDE56353.1 glycerophosphoryl diester phosphodiesterase [Paenibacillus sp. cl123]SFW66197.1 glycerophosphoryl diester phosphodiesterase [Paenibacillus sp. UNCCL117]